MAKTKTKTKTKTKSFDLTKEEQDALTDAGMSALRELKRSYEEEEEDGFTPDEGARDQLISGLDKLGANIDWETLDPDAM